MNRGAIYLPIRTARYSSAAAKRALVLISYAQVLINAFVTCVQCYCGEDCAFLSPCPLALSVAAMCMAGIAPLTVWSPSSRITCCLFYSESSGRIRLVNSSVDDCTPKRTKRFWCCCGGILSLRQQRCTAAVHTPVALTLEWRGGEFHIKQTRAGGEID